MKDFIVKKGGNGKVEITSDKATKFLIGKGFEKVKRFEREVAIMHSLNGKFGNVVPILEYNLNVNPPWYSMPRYHGTLDDLLDSLKGNVTSVIDLFSPVVETLKELTNLPHPIFHRDLKPDNLLLNTSVKKTHLMIADFGCAFLQTGEDDRLTKDFRTVGPMMFRAPEYQAGRVQEVSNKGDIFSLGKILWYAVNGVKDEVFPYTLWYPSEYNLENRFQDNLGVLGLNLLIARMVNHDPSKRPSYDEIQTEFEKLLSKGEKIVHDPKLQLLVKKAEAEKQLKDQLIVAKVPQISKIFNNDLRISADYILELFGSDSPLLIKFQRSTQTQPRRDILSSIQQGSVSSLWTFKDSNLECYAFLHGTNRIQSYRLDTELPFIRVVMNVINSSTKKKTLQLFVYFNKAHAIKLQERMGEEKDYTQEAIQTFLIEALKFYFT